MASIALSIGLMASLNRREEGTVPSFPAELTLTGALEPVIVPCQIPAMYVAVCVPCAPMQIVLDSAATPALPISMLLLPLVRLVPAEAPTVMSLAPVVLF